MGKELHKNEIVKLISQKLSGEKIVIGGNKEYYKRKYHLKYTQKIILKVLDAFWDVVADAVEEGDTVKIADYIKIEPKYYKEVNKNASGFKGVYEYIIPEKYKLKFKMGRRLKQACENLTERCREGKNNHED